MPLAEWDDPLSNHRTMLMNNAMEVQGFLVNSETLGTGIIGDTPFFLEKRAHERLTLYVQYMHIESKIKLRYKCL